MCTMEEIKSKSFEITEKRVEENFIKGLCQNWVLRVRAG